MEPFAKCSNLKFTKFKLQNEEYRFRTRTGLYKPKYEEGSANNGQKREIFMNEVNKIYEQCMHSTAKR